MRKELCYKIFDEQLRNCLLQTFYEFEELLYCGDMAKIGQALKKFNLDVLRAFQKKGLSIFNGLVYTPFGNDIELNEIIKKVKEINF